MPSLDAGPRPRRDPPRLRAAGPLHPPDAPALVADARRALRRVGGAQGRELAEGRRVQDPRGVERDVATRRRREGARRRHPLLGQPRPGPGPRGADRRRARLRGHAEDRPGDQAGRHRGLRRDRRPLRADPGRPRGDRRPPDRRARLRADPPVRQLARHRGPGDGRLGAARPGRAARRRDLPRRRRRPARGDRADGQGPVALDPRRRRRARRGPTTRSVRSNRAGSSPRTTRRPSPTACGPRSANGRSRSSAAASTRSSRRPRPRSSRPCGSSGSGSRSSSSRRRPSRWRRCLRARCRSAG